MTLMTTVLIALSSWMVVSLVVGLFVGRALSVCSRYDAAPALETELPFRRAA